MRTLHRSSFLVWPTLAVVFAFASTGSARDVSHVIADSESAVSTPSCCLDLPKTAAVGPPLLSLTVVEDSLHITRHGWGLEILGEVRNDNDVTTSTSVVEVAVVDASGHLVKTSIVSGVGVQPETTFLSDSWDILPPGTAAWFQCHLVVPEEVEIGEILIDARSIETDLVAAQVPLDIVEGWEIGNDEPPFSLTASIRNTSSSDLVGVSVRIALRNPDGELLETFWIPIRGEMIGGYWGGLRSGETAELMTLVHLDADQINPSLIETRTRGRVWQGSLHQYGVVGVAHLAGANGSFWTSSLNLTNRSGATGTAELSFRQREFRKVATVEIPDGNSKNWTDVVRTLFGIHGPAAGYVQVTSNVPLTVTGRTVNTNPSGGHGQSLPVVTPAETWDLVFSDHGLLSPVRGGPHVRTNLGLVNLTDESCRVRVRLVAPDGTPLVDLGNQQLEPTSWRQINDILPDDVAVAYATIEHVEVCSIWAYASVIDESSGDPTTIEVELVDGKSLPGAALPPGGFVFGGGWAD